MPLKSRSPRCSTTKHGVSREAKVRRRNLPRTPLPSATCCGRVKVEGSFVRSLQPQSRVQKAHGQLDSAPLYAVPGFFSLYS